MKKLKELSTLVLSNTPFFLVVFFAAIFCLKIVVFSLKYGAIEHDSGWFSGVARSLAEYGKYASFSNPLTSDDTKIAQSEIFGRRFSLQDEEGMVYFSSGVSVGPGFIFPQALFLKVFGFKLKTFKILPLIYFTGMVFLCLRLAWQLGGALASVFLLIWWWGLPQMHLGMAYEALAEHVAMFYLLVSIMLWHKFWKNQGQSFFKKKYFSIFFSGLLLGFSYQTKLIFFVFLPAFALCYLMICWKKYHGHWKEGLYFLSGALLPVLIFEIYRYCVLTKLFGADAYAINNSEHASHFQTGGGALPILLNLNWNYLILKASIVKNIGIKYPFLLWPFLFFSGLYFFRQKSSDNRVLVVATAIISLWYVLVSATGLARHFYPGIIFIQILCAGLVAQIFQKIKSTPRSIRFWAQGLLCLICLWPLPEVFDWDLSPNLSNVEKWSGHRFINKLQGFPTNPLFSLADQQEVVDFMQKHRDENNMFYHVLGLLVAELSSLSGKVFYPEERMSVHQQKYPERNFFVVMGPYIVADHPARVSWLDPQFSETVEEDLCKQTVFQNGSYVICQAK